MLQITIPPGEMWDEIHSEFVSTKGQTLTLEHSLVSLSKWESKWHKPFLSKEPKTQIETIDYIKCMTLTQNVDPNIYQFITRDNINEINAYIDNPMTATTFSDRENKKPNRNIITAEIIYYWMIALNVPMECQKWHLNRLLTLIKVCDIKNQPDKKMSRNEVLSRNKALNAARRKQHMKR